MKYWNNQTLASIIDHGENECKHLPMKKDSNIFDIPNPVIIQGAPVKASFSEVCEAVLEEDISAVCKGMKTNIMQKQDKNTGLLLCIPNCRYVAWMFKKGNNGKILAYNIFGIDEERDKRYIYETFKDITSGVSFLWWLLSGKRNLLG